MTTSQIRPASIDDLTALVGTELGPTDWHTLTQIDINTFADITGDHQWIHVDPARAAEGPYGATIGHGLFTLSLGPALTEQLISFDGFAHSLNYGYDKVRFPHPRPVGTHVRMRATIADVTARGESAALVRLVQTFEADGIAKPICVAESLALFSDASD